MLFGLFGARNASTNIPSVGTEDDTFAVLRRIPMQDLESRLSHIVPLLRTQLAIVRRQTREEARSLARSEFMNRWIPFYFQPTSMYQGGSIEIKVHINGDDWERYFVGTGWTPNDYIDELNKIFDKEDAEEAEKQRILNRNVRISSCCSGAIAGIIVWFTPTAIFGWFMLSTFAAAIGVVCGAVIKKYLPK